MDFITISKTISYILRHGAKEKVSRDGFMTIDDLIQALYDKNYITVSHFIIQQIVDNDEKNRFYIKDNLIRANQGHSRRMDIKVELREIQPFELVNIVHGTYKKHLKNIMTNGLNSGTRDHIHCVKDTKQELMRPNCNARVYINVQKAMDEKIKFYESKNGVVLTSGIDNVLAPKYLSVKAKNASGEWENWYIDFKEKEYGSVQILKK
jgi:2'-phosphotransferase